MRAGDAEAVDLRHDGQGAVHAQGARLQSSGALARLYGQHCAAEPHLRPDGDRQGGPGQEGPLHLLRALPGALQLTFRILNFEFILCSIARQSARIPFVFRHIREEVSSAV